MARDSKIAEGLHAVKLQVSGEDERSVITLPREIRQAVGFAPQAGFIVIRAVGPVVVLAQVKSGVPADIERETTELIDRAVTAWAQEIEDAAREPSANGSKG
jgi:hypothetical protein